MPLKIEKLQKVRHLNGGSIVAQCPACAAAGLDRQGNHLRINSAGAFCCVTNPGKPGAWHRKKIYRLAGESDRNRQPMKLTWTVKRKAQP